MLSQLYHEGLIGSRTTGTIPGRSDDDRNFLRFTVIGSIFLAAVYILTGGSMFASMSIIGLAAVLVVTMFRVDWGLMLFVGVVLLFDESPPRGYGMSIIGREYFLNLKSLPLFKGVPPAVLSPLELHLLFVLLVWFLLILTRKRVFVTKVSGWGTALIFFSWLLISAIIGIAKGGDFLPALWEIRALFYLGVMFFFVPQIIQSKEQVRQLVWVIIAGVSFKLLQGLVRVANLGFSFGRRDELTSHEDPLFFISMFVLMSALYIFRVKGAQRFFLTLTFIPMLMVFLMAQRRATWAALGVSVIAFLMLLEWNQVVKFAKILLPFALAATIYLVVFWNSPSGGIGHGAFLVRSSFSSSREEAGERYYSNLYRKMEDYDLAQTVKRAPVMGIGFGNKYDQPLKLFRIPFPLAAYIPHNEIFWIFVKTGAIGFCLFWVFFYSHVFRAATLFRRIEDPYLKSLCAVIMIAVLGQVIVSFYDLQLTYSRNMVYLGTLMGLYPALERAHRQDTTIPKN